MEKEYIWITVPKNSKAGGLTFRHLVESTTLCTTKEKRKLKTCRCPDSGNAWGRHEIFPSVSEGYTGCMCCLRIPPKKIQLDFGTTNLMKGSGTVAKPYDCSITPRSPKHEAIYRADWAHAQAQGIDFSNIKFQV